MPILFHSTNNNCEPVSFETALFQGLAPDKGLYLPSGYPVFSRKTILDFSNLSYPELACTLILPFLSGTISEQDCLHLTEKAYDFEIPLEKITGNHYLLRLDCGPTHSFKDFGARMMALLMGYYKQGNPEKLMILTATSGDTGSAIANAFQNMENITVIILFPRHEISTQQRKQMTTLGQNVKTIAIEGKFDDCQALVKHAFSDPDLHALNLTSANSINIGRLLPQSVYYFYSYACAKLSPDEQVIFSVPSGNFGNACGGLMAKKMGLPISKMILPTNSNDSFPKLLHTKIYHKVEPSKHCISSAMNVGHPSNLARLIAFYDGKMDETGLMIQNPDFDSMHADIFSQAISDRETQDTIHRFFQEHNILIEPHGAVGLAGLHHYLRLHPEKADSNQRFITLETAHPAKFPEEIRNILSFEPDLPASFTEQNVKEEKYEIMDGKYRFFKEYLLSNQ